jgi:hypothetical protein
MRVNQGEVRNRGFEIQANWLTISTKTMSYFVSGNFSTLRNWVSDIGVKNADGTPGYGQIILHSEIFLICIKLRKDSL